MKTRKKDCSSFAKLNKNMEFSKQFFNLMSDSGKGLTHDDLSEWLISLGLAIDSNFVKKIMKMLAPYKFVDG